MAINRAHPLKRLYYTERHIAAGTDHIETQRRVIERLEAAGRRNSATAVSARTLPATMEQAQAGHIADRDKIRRLLAKAK